MKETEQAMELAVIVKGEIVSSNFDEFARMVDAELAEINTNLKSDADFGQAEKDVKMLKKAEDNIKDIKTDLLDQMTEVNELLKGLDEKDEDVRELRLELSRQIKSKKAEIKQQHVDDALESIHAHWKEDYRSQVAEAVKGKSNLDNIRKATQEVADRINKKHEANKVIVNAAMKEHGAGIAPDHRTLLDMDESALRDQIARRVELQIERKQREVLDAKRKAAEKELAELKRQDEKSADKEPLPEPKKVGSIPVVNKVEQTAEEELKTFLSTLRVSFAPVKAARGNLKHASNIKAGEKFAETLKAAWFELKGGAE